MNALNRLPWSEQQKIAAWTACEAIPGLNPRDWRRDAYGFTLYRADYGKQSEYGWEIDHRHPSALGGVDELHNLRALHWRKNRELGGSLGNALRALSEMEGKPVPQPGNVFNQGLAGGRGMFGARKT